MVIWFFVMLFCKLVVGGMFLFMGVGLFVVEDERVVFCVRDCVWVVCFGELLLLVSFFYYIKSGR